MRKSKVKLRGLSLFANVGIAEALFEDSGIDIIIANEIDSKRANFYSAIYPQVEMICGDITDPKVRDKIVNRGLEQKVNFIIATPPCQGMSEAGKRNVFDERNQLIYHTIDVIKRIRPDYVFIENVPKMLTTKIIIKEKVILMPEYIKKELGNDYVFNNETLIKSREHGVAQMRQRNIYLLVRKGLKVKWEFPKKEEVITLRKALCAVPSLDPMLREGADFTNKVFPEFNRKKARGIKVSKWHYPPMHSWKQVEWMIYTPSGKSAIYNEKHYPRKATGERIKAHHNNYRRMNWDKPSRTITQNNGVISSLCCVHPGFLIKNKKNIVQYSDPRVLSIYELMIVTTLPVNWPIPDWADDGLIRKVIGEGIPSLLVRKIMNQLLEQIN